MAFDAHKNFAYSTVATAPSPATSGTSLVVAAGDGAKFPAAPFNVTIWPTGVAPTAANAEIARCTAIATDTLTITRAQESSTARTVVVGDQIAATITVKTLTDIESATGGGGSGAAAGLLGSTQYVNQNFTTTSATAVQVTGLTCTVTVPAGGRSVKITVTIPQFENLSAGYYCELSVWRGAVGSGTRIGTVIQGNFTGIPSASLPGAFVALDAAPAAGLTTYNVGLAAPVGGTAQVYSPNTPGVPMLLLVEGV